MAILKGHILRGHASASGGGIHWQQLDFRDPGVLTILVDSLPAGRRTATIPGVLYPQEDESEAWTFNLDAVREEAHPTLARGFPPWASGRVRAEPKPEGGMWRFDITPQLLGR